MLGNVVCLVGYVVVLWRFFNARVKREFFLAQIRIAPFCSFSILNADTFFFMFWTGEEKALVTFFGSDYVKYRERTMVGIPGIS